METLPTDMEYKLCNWIETLAGDNVHAKAGLDVLKSKFRWARNHEEAEEHEDTPGEDGPQEWPTYKYLIDIERETETQELSAKPKSKTQERQ